MVIVRRSLPLRVLCLLLIACVLCCSCLMPYAQAVVIAGAAAYGAVELIAAMLIGGGVVYATSDEARSAAAQVYDWLASNASAALDKINFWVAQAIVGGVSTGIRVSRDIWDMIASAFGELFSSASNVEYNREYSFPYASDLEALSSLLSKENAPTNKIKTIQYKHVNSDTVCEYSLVCLYENGYTKIYIYENGENNISIPKALVSVNEQILDYGFALTSYSSLKCLGVIWYRLADGDHYVNCRNVTLVYPNFGCGTYWFSGDAVSPAPDLVFPSDNSLVRVPDLPDVQTDEEGKEVVVYPDLSLNPTDHLADIPKQETGEQVDVPYDTLVDVGTGEAVGEGEGVENPDIPTEGTDTGLIQNILDKITNFFDSPSDFKLDFDGFKNLILPDRFPFCIPFDLINSVRVFAASAANFSFDIDLETSYFSVHHTVDLSPFAVPIAFFRYTCVLFWIWVLITRTRDLMKW